MCGDGVDLELNTAFVKNGVVWTQNDDLGLPFPRQSGLNGGVAHDRDTIASFAQMGRGAVEHDLAGAMRPGNGVGLKALAIGQVAAEDLLKRVKAYSLHQIRGDREAP